MKFLSFLFILISASVQADTIYGPKIDIQEVSKVTDRSMKKNSKAVAMLVPRQSRITQSKRKTIHRTASLKDSFTLFGSDKPFCAEVPYQNQNVLGECSAFLISEKHMLTAGHCLRSQEACENFDVVFDYTLKTKESAEGVVIPNKSLYHCQKIISSATEDEFGPWGLDYTLFELDRKVEKRKPVKLRLMDDGAIDWSQKFFTLSHPLGLPMKVSMDAHVSSELGNYYSMNLDIFAGSSGAPVFNQNNEVIGIVIGERNDFVSIGECTGLLWLPQDEVLSESVLKFAPFLEDALSLLDRQIFLLK
ncbi:MAG: trypsin-like peptidase domain-containing protein [Halobacteriovoraceae bacterium]|nr:trypsin-like peptidase domain-containing protein [Halobacteriovoraceae bacterium]MCB9094142.1 trypsin-like peptidase domain-containing protein [Halobacteriovoraceae bacterium]